MKNGPIIISEAKLSSGIALVMLPAILIAVIIIAEFLGNGLGNGIYYDAFGPVIYFIFFGGLAYAIYEFTKIIRGRSHYLIYSDGFLRVLQQKSVKLDQIRSIGIERKFFWRSLVIRNAGGEAIRIRNYMLQRDLMEVKSAIEALQESVVR